MKLSVLSTALLVASAAAARITVYSTVVTTKTLTVTSKSWTWRRFTTTVLKPTTVTKYESYTVYKKGPPVTVTKTIKECPSKEDDGDKEGEGEGEGEGEEEVSGNGGEDDKYKTCPPGSVVVVKPTSTGNAPCLTKPAPQPTVKYQCNCGAEGVMKRTVTVVQSCGTYMPTFYTFVPSPVERCVQPGGVSDVTI
ncbi:hypothetical protein TWF102_001797 [Orbilia oligospora]|uniref:Uncharacterized protein n=1 Tax=Orbilia oligospora TaxID=2813651 RepID=A0A7C8NTQ0_ORBOL|nr:hypothetical protein TWF706_007854 [Orbilia oligospora]KAF3105892.1 hypothetical protein TWF102_001797 [Orbilia oligospora]KAF3112554.1 hypothetical protein TWF103_002803 [Orbilia oligospora]KAF3127322.1 hypothetical protein TWF703_010018 [Orbilia oligospora]KAF3136897.1 hypothetical protein TWF594_007783 [Orbilia oligospora]